MKEFYFVLDEDGNAVPEADLLRINAVRRIAGLDALPILPDAYEPLPEDEL